MKDRERLATDKEMMLQATDIIRTVAGHQKGFKRIVGRLLNKVSYIYYKRIKGDM